MKFEKRFYVMFAGAVLTTSVLTGCIVSVDAADSDTNSSYHSSANSSADVSRVNGSISLADNAAAKSLTTVNGSIKLGQAVQISSAETVNGSIKAAEALRAAKGLSTVNGSIEVGKNSDVAGAISTVNGAIRLTGTRVGADVSTVNGDIRLQASTVVAGDIIFAEKKRGSGWFNNSSDKNLPTLYISADSVVKGKIILRQPVKLHIENAALTANIVQEY